jgi:putative transposase
VSRMTQTFARNYAGLFNGRHRRTGMLWEGRYKSCLVGSERYVLACRDRVYLFRSSPQSEPVILE